jgi:hypothetical protein
VASARVLRYSIATTTLPPHIAGDGDRSARPANLPIVGRCLPIPGTGRPKARTAAAQQCRRQSREAAVTRGVRTLDMEGILLEENADSMQSELPQPPRHGRNNHRHGGPNGAGRVETLQSRTRLQLERTGEDIEQRGQNGYTYTESRSVYTIALGGIVG